MKDIKDNPLKAIFSQTSDGKYSSAIKSFQNINNFFTYLTEKKNSVESKIITIE